VIDPLARLEDAIEVLRELRARAADGDSAVIHFLNEVRTRPSPPPRGAVRPPYFHHSRMARCVEPVFQELRP